MNFYEQNEDEIIMVYFAVYIIDFIKILYFMKINVVDVMLITVGNCIFYRRYLLVMKINAMCDAIIEPLHDVREIIHEILEKKI